MKKMIGLAALFIFIIVLFIEAKPLHLTKRTDGKVAPKKKYDAGRVLVQNTIGCSNTVAVTQLTFGSTPITMTAESGSSYPVTCSHAGTFDALTPGFGTLTVYWQDSQGPTQFYQLIVDPVGTHQTFGFNAGGHHSFTVNLPTGTPLQVQVVLLQ